jgi:hypothetical protein
VKRAAGRTAGRLLLALAVGALFFELGLRLLATSPWTRASTLARKVGSPSRFAFQHEDLYWNFVRRLATSEAPSFEPPHDPQLGWTWPLIRPGSYEHAEERWLEGRRPVLLFGDSYSACLTGREACFEGLHEASPLATRSQLLNYGVCGYGFDQTWLLARAAVARHAALDPAVVIGILLDDDLRRMLLTLREYPKPRLRVADGRVVVPGEPIASLADLRAAPPPLPLSWSWTWLRRALRSNPLDDPESTERRELEQLTRALLGELVADLRARELDYFFLLFHPAHGFRSEGDWGTRLLRDTLDELGAPWYDVREELARRLAEGGGSIEDFYIPLDRPGGGHYDAQGNAAAFAVLARGLEERCGISARLDGPPPTFAFRRTISGGGGVASFTRGVDPPFDAVPSDSRLILRAPRIAPSAISYLLEGHAERFRARVWAHDLQGEPRTFELDAILDGATVQRLVLRAGEAPREFELDLRGSREFVLSLAVHEGQGYVVLSDPQIE